MNTFGSAVMRDGLKRSRQKAQKSEKNKPLDKGIILPLKEIGKKMRVEFMYRCTNKVNLSGGYGKNFLTENSHIFYMPRHMIIYF